MILGVVCAVLVAHLAESRGPHHPRGEPVVRHYTPTKDAPEKLLEDAQLLHDKEHLKEHLEEIIDKPDLSQMSSEELEFYYFQVHDTDKNNKLDGLEILQAILHTMHEHEDPENGELQEKAGDFEYFVEVVDRVLMDEDLDMDGFLSYPEYASGRKKALIAERKKEPNVKMIP